MSIMSRRATLKQHKHGTTGLRTYTIWLFLAALIVVMSFAADNYFTLQNLINVLRSVTHIALLAFGLTFVFLSGGFDLSQGATLILSATLIVSLNPEGGLFFVVYLFLILAVAAVIGSVNGFLIGILQLNPFIVTLGTRSIIGGFIFIYAAGMVVSAALQAPILEFIGLNRLFGFLPVQTLIWIVIAVICLLVVKFTAFARKITAVGSSVTVARFSGLRVKELQMSTYIINGLIAGAAGILLGCQTSHIAPSLVWHYDFDAITACAVGGISLSGGKGTILATISGVLLLGFINNSMILLGLPYTLQLILKGIVLLAVIIIDTQGKHANA